MAQRPDGRAAKTQATSFTRPAAERIAKVVRKVEAGDRKENALSFQRIGGGGDGVRLRLATFTGDWQVGESKVVTLEGSTNTANVYNWCNPALGSDTSSSTETRYVIFGRVQGTQSVVEIQLENTNNTCSITLGSVDVSGFPGYSSGQVQLLGHNESACLQWYSITTCATT